MEKNVIEIVQLPIIEEQLQKIKSEIEHKIDGVLALDCTEESCKEVKKERAELNKLYAEFETRRKEVKAKILEPYDKFEKIYKSCIEEPFKQADSVLKCRIADIENSAKNAKVEALNAYFSEYRESLGLREEDAPFGNARINVTLSASLKSLKEAAKRYLDSTADAIAAIREQEYADEIMVEFRRSGNANQAMLIVNQRHREIEAEAERKRNEDSVLIERLKGIYGDTVNEEPEITPPETFLPPTESKYVEDEQIPVSSQIESTEPQSNAENVEEEADEEVYEVTFTILATLGKIKILKKFLEDGEYDYE